MKPFNKNKPFINIKNFENIRDKTRKYTKKFKKTFEDKSKSASEIKESIKKQANNLIEELKQDTFIVKKNFLTKIKNVDLAKFLKVLPYILIALLTLITYDSVLASVFIKAVSITWSSSTRLSPVVIVSFLRNVKSIFLQLNTIEQCISMIAFLHVALHETPIWFDPKRFEGFASHNSFIEMLYSSLKKTSAFNKTVNITVSELNKPT
jgi:uncharacterized membrane protein